MIILLFERRIKRYIMKKEGLTSYASAKWLRSEARETHKDNVFFCVFLCILWALKTNRRIVMGKILKIFILLASMLLRQL